MINVSVYAGDAERMALPLLGGDGTSHDWHALLTMAHLLPYTHSIAGLMFTLGLLVLFMAAYGSVYYARTFHVIEKSL